MQDFTPELHQLCFSFLNEEEARRIWSMLTWRTLDEAEVLFASGDEGDELYFLLNGKVAVQHSTGFGDRMQVVALLDPGAVIGESGLLDGRKRGATVVATKRSEIAALPAAEFTVLAESEPFLVHKIFTYLLNRVTLRLQKSSERLARVL